MESLENKLFKRIRSRGRGAVFSARTFVGLGSADSIRKAFQTLARRGIIRRLAWGVYDYPQRHPQLGTLMPSPEAIAQALAGRDQTRLQPSGAYAANLLGLSLQVPARIEFLTDGPSRKVQVGKQTIVLRQTVPRNMAAAGRVTGLIIQALRHLGQAHVNGDVLKKLNRQLTDQDVRMLIEDIRLAPVWIQKIIRDLAHSRGVA
jgi:hypothetical protein